MNSLDVRLKEFLPGPERQAVILDASAGLSLGVLPSLEDFGAGLRPHLSRLDGLVCSPGQLRRLMNRTQAEAALLVRMDWTNTLRSQSFALAPESATRVSILDASGALELGAAAMVVSFLLGYDESMEADCLKSMVQLALTGKELGLPLVVEVVPSGPRISLPDKAVELGASYALEGGADVIVVPYPGPDSMNTLSRMLSVPWLLKTTSLESSAVEWEQALGLGASGVWLDHSGLRSAPAMEKITNQVHKIQQTNG